MNLQMESTCLSIHEILKVVEDTQTKYRLREAQDRLRAEDLNERVYYWSIGQSVIICVVSIGQVFMLKSFFKEKKVMGIQSSYDHFPTIQPQLHPVVMIRYRSIDYNISNDTNKDVLYFPQKKNRYWCHLLIYEKYTTNQYKLYWVQ